MTDSHLENAVKVIVDQLGYLFSNELLLEQALTHKSFTNETPKVKQDNQRLEFLGDAVIGLAVAETLMNRLPDANEGLLTQQRAALVKEESLVDLAQRIGLGDLLRLGKGEEMNDGRNRASILADAVEAVAGAVHQDGGYEIAKRVILDWMDAKIDYIFDNPHPEDVKTSLQEMLQAKNANTPEYTLVKEEGPDHEKLFEVEISVGGTILARGRGKSKKEAEKEAARHALEEVEKL